MNLFKSTVDVVGRALHAAGALRLLHEKMYPESVSILMYHGLVDAPLPMPQRCFLSLERFARQMEYLARHCEVVHLEDAFAAARRRPSRPLACVTFDDGFASVHDLAMPILERWRIPATVYLVTDLVDSAETVWFAHIHQAIWETSVPEVHLHGRRFPLKRPVDREEASIGVQRALKSLARPDFSEALEDLLAQLGFQESRPWSPWKAFRILTTEEIQRMSRDDLVRFGAHTASHQILTRTSREDARREIERSVAAVAALVARPSGSFAYPNGGFEDFNRTTIEALRRAGIDYAVSAIEGPNGPGTDPYVIRRYLIDADDTLFRFAGRVHHTRDAARELVRKFRRS